MLKTSSTAQPPQMLPLVSISVQYLGNNQCFQPIEGKGGNIDTIVELKVI